MVGKDRGRGRLPELSLAAAVVAVVLLAALATEVVLLAPSTGLDRTLSRSIGGSVSKQDYDWAVPITGLGAAPTILAVLALAAIVMIRAHRRREAIALVLAAGMTSATVRVLKYAVGRDRPTFGPLSESTPSFPSGHAASSMALYGLLAYMALRMARGAFRWLLFAGASLLVVAIGLSRVYLGVHYPSDVIAGWLVGLLGAAAAWKIAERGSRWRGDSETATEGR